MKKLFIPKTPAEGDEGPRVSHTREIQKTPRVEISDPSELNVLELLGHWEDFTPNDLMTLLHDVRASIDTSMRSRMLHEPSIIIDNSLNPVYESLGGTPWANLIAFVRSTFQYDSTITKEQAAVLQAEMLNYVGNDLDYSDTLADLCVALGGSDPSSRDTIP